MRFIDRLAAGLVCLLGVAHLVVGHGAFLNPTERRIWFLSAGFLLIVTGMANLGAIGGNGRMQSGAAAAGALSILIIGSLLALANNSLLSQPQTIVLLLLGLILSVRRIRDVFAADRR